MSFRTHSQSRKVWAEFLHSLCLQRLFPDNVMSSGSKWIGMFKGHHSSHYPLSLEEGELWHNQAHSIRTQWWADIFGIWSGKLSKTDGFAQERIINETNSLKRQRKSQVSGPGMDHLQNRTPNSAKTKKRFPIKIIQFKIRQQRTICMSERHAIFFSLVCNWKSF